MKLFSIVGMFAILCLGADGAKEKSSELDKFQGKWQAEKAQFGGEEVPAIALKNLVFNFKADQMIPVDNPSDVSTVEVNGSKTPAEIDLVDPKKSANRLKGIYRFTGNGTLELCMNSVAGDRPKDFTPAKGSKAMLMVLKKSKD